MYEKIYFFALGQKKSDFMKNFHKMVTPPPPPVLYL